MTTAKSFDIPKRLVWEAYKHVKANGGAAGVDEQSLAEFEGSSGTTCIGSGIGWPRGVIFHPRSRPSRFQRSREARGHWVFPPSRDRIAQTVVKSVLEPQIDPHFHEDSYGYSARQIGASGIGGNPSALLVARLGAGVRCPGSV